MSITCEMAAPFVANAAVEKKQVTRLFRRHTNTCLKCQARHSAMAKTARELALLSDTQFRAPADLEWRVMSSLEGDLALTRSIKTPMALVAAGVSMAAAVLLWRIRPRPQA